MISTDVKLYLSGGVANADPLESVGGDMSSTLVDSDLFNNLSGEQSRAGLIDYRCIYAVNTHGSESFRKVKFYVDYEGPGGSFIDIGAIQRNEIQKVLISGIKPPNEGEIISFTVPDFGDFIVPYHINPTIWQGRFQTEIRGIDGLSEVNVGIAGEIGWPTEVMFTLNFLGESCCRNMSLIEVITHDLDSQSISIFDYQQGSPVNIATPLQLDDEITAPDGVFFRQCLRGNPLQLGDLHPGDKVPIWIRRTTPSGSMARKNDSFRLFIDGIFP